jgi:hypothetical protein
MANILVFVKSAVSKIDQRHEPESYFLLEACQYEIAPLTHCFVTVYLLDGTVR